MTRFPGRVFFFEEPMFDGETDVLSLAKVDGQRVTIVTPHLGAAGDLPVALRLRGLLDDLIEGERISRYISWYYSPMALTFSAHLDPILTVYDCMDELSAFKFAPAELKELELKLLSKADLVFTGGNKLFEAKKKFHTNLYSFPSSIDKAHFLLARGNVKDPIDQASIPHPRLGFYGVLDERLDIQLLDELARLRPEWNIVLVGPVVKIDPQTLPSHSNIHYLGAKKYDELPAYLSGWDIAIMPFAINESTEFISPTKTPEYLCGGKPVISTPISDVVNDYGQQGLVLIAGNAGEFVTAAESLLNGTNRDLWLQRVDEKLSNVSWDVTWEQMEALMDSALIKKLSNPIPLF
jgi:UDP-galactopyranose mutase